MFGKLYYPYRPTKYWWALIIIWKKFFVVLFGIMFRDFPTFQMAITLFVVFLAFSAHVDNDPFMGMIEKAEIIRSEAEETILREIKKLERAQLLVRINGKAYYQLMHSMRVQIDEQEAIMAKHHNSPFNYNTIESVFLMTSCVVVLAGIMFDSDWILERIVVPEYEIRGKVISYLVMFLVIFSVIYYVVVFVHECRAAAKRQRTSRQLMWARVKANTSKIRGMGVKNILAGHKDYKTGKVVVPGNPKRGLLSSAQALAKGKAGKKSGAPGFNLSKVVPFKPQKGGVADALSVRSNIGAPAISQKKEDKHRKPRGPYEAVLVKGAGPHGIKLGTRSAQYSVTIGPGSSGIDWREDPKGGVFVKTVDVKMLGVKNKRVKPGHHLMKIEGQDVSRETLKNSQSPLSMLKDQTRTLTLELMTLPKHHVVVAISDGSAAKKAGNIRIGHILKAVGTTDISNMTNEEAVKVIGSVERPHTLTLVRGEHHHHHHHHHARKHNLTAQVAKEIAPQKKKGPEDSSSDSNISSSSGSGSSSDSSSSSSSGGSDDEAMAGLNNQVNSSKTSDKRKGESVATLRKKKEKQNAVAHAVNGASDSSSDDEMEMHGLDSKKGVALDSKDTKAATPRPPPPPGTPAKSGSKQATSDGGKKHHHHHHHHHKDHGDKDKDEGSDSSSSGSSSSGSSSSGSSSDSSSGSDSD
jgi:uncharacterized membrane protein YgcG